jgi:hypothetical protein
MGLVSAGLDTYCLDALISGRLVSGVQLVAQRCYHRLITPTGTLRGGEEEADFGIDLADYVGSTAPDVVDATLRVRVVNELRKDPAVDFVTCAAVRSESGGEVSWTLTIDITTTLGDVQLILAVSAVSVQLLGVT